ncbi:MULTISPECIES: hypothetical protein [Marinomonas]|uniref:Uncharacterized protein n=1 Tax=Marinomonas arctica TaxID=383750 RepID=A0A7H1J711_9GAMM|nr:MULTISPECIES: hypothetical protein [Marinomonas]MCS7485682.1 hypothetical protein [Marinomonas sp. BSi20414]QNT06277.1 hypothetical protein IBG28_01010 [Marinomonas arctica]GGN28906.1 hypothetical protein GCM10011350_21000 [Marinomonas arctica]
MIKGDTEFLEVRSERECAFYTDYLLSSIRSASLKNLRGDTHTERVKKLNEELDNLVKRNRAPKNFATQMRSAFKATQLPSSYFRWIDKKDERLCNWIWCYLKSHTKKREANQEQGVIQENTFLLLSEKAFSTERDNVSDRLVDVLNAFYDGEADAQQQQDLLDELKTKWQSIRFNETIVQWLEDNNPAQWAWAWSYLQNITQRPLEQAWIPTSNTEKKAAVIATIDLSDNVDRKALVIDKMKKAWSQKKFREKSSGKKPYSISMTLNTKQKLNALAEEKNMKINEMIEYLVRNEYKRRDSDE